MTQALYLRNATLLQPSRNLQTAGELLLANGLVHTIHTGAAGALDQQAADLGAQVIDCTGLYIAPGLIDAHVHLREPGQTHKETISTGTAAAAAGGVTTVVAMPNTVPVTDSVDLLRFVQSTDRDPHVRVLCMPAATVGSMGVELTDYAALQNAGAVGFTDDGKPILDDDVMRQALTAAARLGLPISQHAEDTRLTVGASINHGPVAFRLGLRGMPIAAESGIVERDIRLLEEIERDTRLKPHLHVQHVSTAAALESIRSAKRRGLHVTCEVAPHHLAFTDQNLESPQSSHAAQRFHAYDTHFKMNPPLRSAQDRDGCIAAVLDGTVDILATDHAPHAAWEKNVEFERAPNGITGLETLLGTALRILHRDHGMPLGKVLALLTSSPATVLNLPNFGGELAGLGSIATGAPADLVIFDPSKAFSYDPSTSRSLSRNTPFSGAPMLGRIHYTVAAGRVQFQQNS